MTSPANQDRRDRAAFKLKRAAVLKAERMRKAGEPPDAIEAYLFGATLLADDLKHPHGTDEATE